MTTLWWTKIDPAIDSMTLREIDDEIEVEREKIKANELTAQGAERLQALLVAARFIRSSGELFEVRSR